MMLELGRTAADELRGVITDALTAGVVTKDEILDMVSTAEPPAATNGRAPAEPATGANDLPIYTELPEGLIDLATAVKQYGLNYRTAHGWINKGELSVLGKVRGRGGLRFLVCEATVARMSKMPKKKGGRPRKSHRVVD